MKDYQLEISYRRSISEIERAILKDYWSQASNLKPGEIAEKYQIEYSELKAIVRFLGKVSVKCACDVCGVEMTLVASSRSDLKSKLSAFICTDCSTERSERQKAEQEDLKAKRLAEWEKEVAFYRDQEEVGVKKLAMAIDKKAWLNLDDEGLLLLREIFKAGEFQIWRVRHTYKGKLTRKVRLYLELFDGLGLIHLVYGYRDRSRIQRFILNDVIFQNLYLDVAVHSELSIHLKINTTPKEPTSPIYKNSVVFSTLRLLEPNKSYLCGLWQLPDGSVNLKIAPADEIVPRAKELG